MGLLGNTLTPEFICHKIGNKRVLRSANTVFCEKTPTVFQRISDTVFNNNEWQTNWKQLDKRMNFQICKVFILLTRAHVSNCGTKITMFFREINLASLICCFTFWGNFLLIFLFLSLMSEKYFEIFKKTIRVDCVY